MREIKFRAWDKDLKDFRTDIIIDNEGMLAFVLEPLKRVKNDGKKIIILQFTGLKDKNGQEIYEGDIVSNLRYGGVAEIIWANDIISKHGEVKGMFGEMIDLNGFLSTLGRFEFKWPEGNSHNAYYLQDMEIIGNIWENPELLGGMNEQEQKEEKDLIDLQEQESKEKKYGSEN